MKAYLLLVITLCITQFPPQNHYCKRHKTVQICFILQFFINPMGLHYNYRIFSIILSKLSSHFKIWGYIYSEKNAYNPDRTRIQETSSVQSLTFLSYKYDTIKSLDIVMLVYVILLFINCLPIRLKLMYTDSSDYFCLYKTYKKVPRLFQN